MDFSVFSNGDSAFRKNKPVFVFIRNQIEEKKFSRKIPGATLYRPDRILRALHNSLGYLFV